MTQNLKYIPYIRLRSILFVVLLLVSGHSIGQGEMDNWFFGNKAGLNFSTGLPQVIPESAINSIEACASISDSDGNLLFYSEASKIFNRNHVVMLNGNLYSNSNNATQGAGIVPMPGNSYKYYVFSLRFTGDFMCALKYDIVDMFRDFNRGEVIEKDHFLLYGITEKLTFVQQRDSPNVWIIVHGFNSDEYAVFLISASGISEATMFATGITHGRRYGYLQPSPDGSMLAAAVETGFNSDGFIEVSRFDPLEGSISESFKLEIPGGPYGVCFSPDNSKLYATAGSPNHLYQFDLSQQEPNLIQDSRVQITSTPFIDYPGSIGALQLAPNGKIYLARYETNSLAAINQPNLLGTECAYVENAVSLDGGGSCEGGLPNFGNLFLDQTPANILGGTDPDDTDGPEDPDEPDEPDEPNQQPECGDLLIIPNPTAGSIIVKSLGEEISSITVYDIRGRLVVPKTAFNSIEVQIDEAQLLAAGTYILQVAHGWCVNEKKVVVMR